MGRARDGSSQARLEALKGQNGEMSGSGKARLHIQENTYVHKFGVLCSI